ncbi:MAG TPA: fumarylacetoacetate hydrolase family protein [Dermatophilaceae bacterium]|nr:fumarylacetoacetate hydrolase family protein [Dermatophilaceae bacterium]
MDPAIDWAQRIDAARATGTLLDPPSASSVPLDLPGAYRVSGLLAARRRARGEQPVGWKLGYTSVAMREQMGVAEPNSGLLTDAMLRPDGTVIGASELRQPRVEPEVALVVGAGAPPPPGEGYAVPVAEARVALEVVDSTWHDYRFTLEDNTADGSSAAFVVLGEPLPGDTDLSALAVVLEVDGEVVARSTGAAAMGSPLTALRWLAEHLAGRGEALTAGSVVITGGLTAAYPLLPGGTVSATFSAGSPAQRVTVSRAAP